MYKWIIEKYIWKSGDFHSGKIPDDGGDLKFPPIV